MTGVTRYGHLARESLVAPGKRWQPAGVHAGMGGTAASCRAVAADEHTQIHGFSGSLLADAEPPYGVGPLPDLPPVPILPPLPELPATEGADQL